jgi:hypothetical protein
MNVLNASDVVALVDLNAGPKWLSVHAAYQVAARGVREEVDPQERIHEKGIQYDDIATTASPCRPRILHRRVRLYLIRVEYRHAIEH